MFARIIKSRKYGQILVIKDITETTLEPRIQVKVETSFNRIGTQSIIYYGTDDESAIEVRDKAFEMMTLDIAETFALEIYKEAVIEEPVMKPIHAYTINDEELWVAESEEQLLQVYAELTGVDLEEDEYDLVSEEELKNEFPETDEMDRPTGRMTSIAEWLRQVTEPGIIASAGI